MDWLLELLKKHKIDIDSEDGKKLVEDVKKTFPENAVPKEQYNKVAEKAKANTAELETAQEKLKNVSDLAEKLKGKEEEIGKIKSSFEDYKKGESERTKKIKIESQLQKNLLKNKANEDSVDLLINEFDYEKLDITDNNEIIGFEDQFKAIKEKRSKLFYDVKTDGEEPKDGDNIKDSEELEQKMSKAMGL